MRLGDGDGAPMTRVPHKKAIVRSDTGHVLGVVTNEYGLVSNQQALDWGRKCCRVVFPETQPDEWEVRAIDGPESGRSCSIDLIHRIGSLNFNIGGGNEREVFAPFIRVTNSFNASRRLGFDVGFIRWICGNGMIVPEAVIRFRISHLRSDLDKEISFDVARTQLAKLKQNFGELLGALRGCAVPRPLFEPLTLGVLAIHEPKGSDKNGRRSKDWTLLKAHIRRLSDHYAGELGENAYAVFNSITDFASRPSINRCVHRDRHSFQRAAGKWSSEFSRQCREPGFKIDDYLKLLNAANGDAKSVNGGRPIRFDQ